MAWTGSFKILDNQNSVVYIRDSREFMATRILPEGKF